MPRTRKPTVREKKYAANRAKGMTQVQAYDAAGYSQNSQPQTKAQEASTIEQRPHVQKLIEDALIKHEATPEFAVGRLKQIAEQDKEIGAARLASKDILELHGWNKADRPTLNIVTKNAFFNTSRKSPE